MGERSTEGEVLALFEHLLSLEEAERADWLSDLADRRPDDARRLRALLAADAITAGVLQTGGAVRTNDIGAAPTRIGAYRITGLIGRGGMGAVYLGERATGDFDHRVAIKVVRPGPLSEILVDRFRGERRILAGLDHPHIARLFDGGETAEGEPYFVMEYVDGATLRDLMRDDAQAGAHLLDIFCQVCSAAQYAHQKLIVHGDITPRNILVEKGGVAKLIDFGISRISDPQEEIGQTVADQAAFTRAYAAPERTSGAPATIASDVYGLGTVLRDIIGTIPAADHELRAIADKATKVDVDQRYGSVAELLADIGRRSAGLPVLAMEGGSTYRLRKLVRRHRVLFGSLAIGVIGLCIALVITTSLYRSAELARESESERFAQVRSLARYQLFDLYEAVANLPQSTPVREQMVRTAQKYLEDLRLLPNASPDLVIETADALRRLGDIQGGPGVANIGDKDGAKASYAHGLVMLHALPEHVQQGDPWKLSYAGLLLSRARSNFFNDFEPDKAVDDAREAELQVSAKRATPLMAATRAIAMAAVGEYLLYAGENGQASGQMLDAERALAALDLTQVPKAVAEEARVRLAANFRNRALALIELKRPADALEALQGGDTLWSEMRRQAPANRRYMRSHAIHLMQLGALHGELGRSERAQAAYAEAEALARLNLSLDPKDEAARFAVESISAERAHYLGTIGRTREALALLDAILERRRALAAAAPADAKRAADVLVMLRPFGDVYKAAGDKPAACRAYRQARAEFEAFDTRHEMNEELRNTEYAAVLESLKSCPR